MKTLLLDKLGGAPLTQDALKWVQDGTTESVGAIAQAFGNYVILSGVELIGPNLTSGWIIVGGEVIRFIGGLNAARVQLNDIQTPRLYADGQNKDFYFERVATPTSAVGTDNSFAFTDLIRIDALLSFQATVKAFIVNTNVQIAALIAQQRVLYSGSISLPDVFTDNLITVAHNQNILIPYTVVGVLVSQGADWNIDNDVFWMVKNCIANEFKLALREVANNVQNLRFEYLLIRK